jgi:hypothetical protein
MNLSDLNSNNEVRYRTGMAGQNDVDWNQWKQGRLFIERRETDLPGNLRKRCRYWKKGDIVSLTPEGMGWATYTQGDYCDNGVFSAEEYYLEIEGLV